MNKFKNAPNIKIPSTNGETFELKKIKEGINIIWITPLRALAVEIQKSTQLKNPKIKTRNLKI